MEDLLEQQEFYELMQTYRHINISNQLGAVYAFEQVKKFIKDNFEPKKANPVENRVMPKIADGLLPCPFCGGNDCLWSEDGYPEVKCLTHSKDSAEVREKWNTRK